MKLRYKIVGVVVAILAVIGGLRFLHRGESVFIPKGSEATIITNSSSIISTIKQGTKTIRKTVPNYGHGTTTTVNHDGDVTIEPIYRGLSNDIGLSTDFTRLGIGLEVGYYYRINLLIGSHFWNMRTQRWDANLFIGMGYRIPWQKLNNVSVYTAIDTDQRILTGVFIRFGS